MARKADPAATIEQARALFVDGRYDEMLAVTEPGVESFQRNPSCVAPRPGSCGACRDDAPHEIATAISLDTTDPWRVMRAASLLFYLGEHEAPRDYIRHVETLPGADHARELDL